MFVSYIQRKNVVKDEILPNLDFIDFNVSVNCIKGKKTKHTKKGEVENFLKLSIRTLVVCLTSHLLVKKNFITFINDFHIIFISIYFMENLKQWIP